jgi:branched-chain amino acid transport system permease protein
MAAVPPSSSTPAPAPPGSSETSEAGNPATTTAVAPEVSGRSEPRPRAVSGVLTRWSSLPRVLVDLVYGVAALAVLFVIANNVSRYRDFQISEIAAYVVVVAGLTLLTGLNGQISLGHGALMAVGAYTTAAFLLHTHLPLVVILLFSVVSGTLFGAAVGAVAARLRGPYLAGATLALAVALPQIPKHYKYFGRDQGLTINPPLPPGWLGTNFPLERWGAYICLTGAVVVVVLLANLLRSRYGREFKAVRDDEIAAAVTGIPVARTQVRAFMISAACAGLGGGLLALVIPTVGPGSFPLTLSIQLLVAIVVGGLGSLTGAILGAIVIVYLPGWADAITSGLGLSKQIGANLALAIFGGALILGMLLLPGGIMGGVQRLRMLARQRRHGRQAAAE